MLKDKYEAVVVAGGEYPTAPIALKILHEAPYVVCCDGAADAYISRGGVPDAIVGDGDSISVCNREKYANRLHIFAEQETNDQTKAMRFLHQMGKAHRYQFPDVVIVQHIVNRASFPAACDQLCLPQLAQLVGNGRLLHIEQLCNGTNAHIRNRKCV